MPYVYKVTFSHFQPNPEFREVQAKIQEMIKTYPRLAFEPRTEEELYRSHEFNKLQARLASLPPHLEQHGLEGTFVQAFPNNTCLVCYDNQFLHINYDCIERVDLCQTLQSSIVQEPSTKPEQSSAGMMKATAAKLSAPSQANQGAGSTKTQGS